MQLLITTSKRPNSSLIEQAQCRAREWGFVYVPRQRFNIPQFCAAHGVEKLLVLEEERLLCATAQGQRLFWHPNMTGHKLKQLLDGGTLPLTEAAALRPGDRVLDGTLGYGSDALLLAYGAGPEGTVLGIEREPVIACLTRDGLDRAALSPTVLGQAARRISVRCGDHGAFLATSPDDSWDVVFLDPMFEATVGASPAMRALKPFAADGALTAAVLENARRVCRRRVVLKERWGSTCFLQNPCSRYYGRLQPGEVVYGVMEK